MSLLAVRLRIKIRIGNKNIDEVALLNSGYETDTPQLLIPIDTARKLGLWPPPSHSKEYIYETAGGPLRVWLIPNAGHISIVTEDESSKEILSDIVISPLLMKLS